MSRFRSRGVAVVALCLLVGAGIAGCSSLDPGPDLGSSPMTCPAAADAPLTLIVGARANSPAPQLPAQVLQLLSAAAAGGQQIQVVRLDGTPGDALQARFSTNAQNQPMRDRDLSNFTSGVEQAVSEVRPTAAQADVLGALSEAARITPAGGTIVLLDSGLATAGAINYLTPGVFGSAPQQVTDYLRKQDLLPDLTGRSVVLVNVGDTADPQPQLPQNLRDGLTALWTQVVTQASAKCVGSIRTAIGRTAISTAVAVTVVPLPVPPSWNPCGSTVLGDDSPVGFVVGTATFRDKNAANSLLAGLATLLVGHGQLVTVAGSTSSEGDPGANQTLSVARADTVSAALVNLGVAADRITAVGYGIHAPGRVPDLTSDGTLIPWAAEKDRSVTVTLHCGSGQ